MQERHKVALRVLVDALSPGQCALPVILFFHGLPDPRIDGAVAAWGKGLLILLAGAKG